MAVRIFHSHKQTRVETDSELWGPVLSGQLEVLSVCFRMLTEKWSPDLVGTLLEKLHTLKLSRILIQGIHAGEQHEERKNSNKIDLERSSLLLQCACSVLY